MTRYTNTFTYIDEADLFSDDATQTQYREELGHMLSDHFDDLIMEDLAHSTFYPHLTHADWSAIGCMPNLPLPTQVAWLRGFREGLSLEDSRSTYPEDFL